MNNRQPVRSLDEWMTLLTECRKSGLSDRAWCDRYGIPPSSFYNAVTKPRKRACEIPPAAHAVQRLDLTSRQEVVRINIVDDEIPALCPEMPLSSVPAQPVPDLHLDNSHMIEIILGTTRILVNNGADPELLKAAVIAAGGISC